VNLFRVIVNLFRFNRTNWKAVSLCFLAATVFWLFNALNKNYSTNIRFPLQFEFDRTKFAPSKPLPRDIYLNVSGHGWDLFRRRLDLKPVALVIPLERPAETRKIVGSTTPAVFALQVGSLKINHVVTDTLYLHLEPKDSGKFKLIVDAHGISFKKGYGRTSPIVVLPDSVHLEGPKSIIEGMADSLVITLPEKKLGSNFRQQVEVIVPGNEFVKRNPPVVEVIFEVGEVVELSKKIPLELINTPASINLAQGTDSITCWVTIPKTRLEDFSQLTVVKALVDLRVVERGQKKVAPVVLGLPSYAEFLRADSLRIKQF
jgi:hypothetical protein